MRLGFDIRKYADIGIGTYTIQNLLKQYDSFFEGELILFTAPQDLSAVSSAHRGRVIESPQPKYSLRELFSLGVLANRAGIDVYHAPHYTLPYGLKSKKVVTIHDIIHTRFPEFFSTLQRMYARRMIQHACSSADAIVTISEHSKNDLLKYFRVREEKIHVILQGISERYVPCKSEYERSQLRNRLNLTGYVILYVGNLKPHKNLGTLLRALARLPAKHEYMLVVIGERLDSYPEQMEIVKKLNLEKMVRNRGRISEDDLICYYQSADVLVMPSLYEGFGAPAVEAMASGVPVIGSNVSSIPEVLGDAGLLFDPRDDEQLARLIESVCHDDELRRGLVTKGLERSKRFRWKDCAEKTIDVYSKVLNQ
jgi:glycosyltransferase involved in cell wall biosynthesis